MFIIISLPGYPFLQNHLKREDRFFAETVGASHFIHRHKKLFPGVADQRNKS
jgi:hypothetical protein